MKLMLWLSLNEEPKKGFFFFFNGRSAFHFGHLTTIPQLNQLYFNDLIAPSLYTRDVPESQ